MALMPVFVDILQRYRIHKILDPFAGTGRIFRLWDSLDVDITAVEIEPKWAKMHPCTTVGDALNLPESWVGRYQAIVTSPTFGNRMADHFVDSQVDEDGNPKYVRNTYFHCLGEELQPNNSGQLPFGPDYCVFEQQWMIEMRRVLTDSGLLVFEMKDSYKTIQRKGAKIKRRVRATLWHIFCAQNLGYKLLESHRVYSNGNTQGANRERVEYSTVLVFCKGECTHQKLTVDNE